MNDRIEKRIELKAPVSRVWRALTDYREFGEWFRVKIDGPFKPGEVSRGQVTYPGYEHLKWEAIVQKMEPERLFSFTWHPAGIDPKKDYSKETPTLVVLDRFGNELVKTSKIEEIHLALKKAVGMARIKWVSEDDPEAATVYRMAGGGKQGVPGIIKTMSLRPQWMEMVFGLAQMSHFRDGALPRKTKEMIATYVSAINHCKF